MLTSRFENAAQDNVPTSLGRTQSARLSVDEWLTNLEGGVSQLGGRLSDVLLKPELAKSQEETANPAVHELHAWTCAVGARIQRLTETVRDLNARLDL